MDLSEFHEMIFELFTCELEVEATDKDFALGVGELDTVLGVIAPCHVSFLLYLAIWVGFLDLLAVVVDHEIVVLVVASMIVPTAAHMTASVILSVMVIC